VRSIRTGGFQHVQFGNATLVEHNMAYSSDVPPEWRSSNLANIRQEKPA
jgi:hypothetical protein